MAEYDPATINYGLDNEAYLTEEQKKLARMIQGKFDSSMEQRDRELARYNAPRLSSYVEDEALARAMTMARAFNTQNDPLGLGINQGTGRATGGGGGGSGGGGSGVGRALYPNDGVGGSTARTGADAQTPAKWQAIMQGMMSLAPILLGKDWMTKISQEGVLPWLYKKTSQILTPDATMEGMAQGGGLPSDGAIVYNPITGQPMMLTQEALAAAQVPNFDQGTDWRTPGFDPTEYNPAAFAPDTSFDTGTDWRTPEPGGGGWDTNWGDNWDTGWSGNGGWFGGDVPAWGGYDVAAGY